MNKSLSHIRGLMKARGREVTAGSTKAKIAAVREDKEPPLDPVKALQHIKTLAGAARDSDDATLLRKHMEMILVLVDKVLPSGPKNPAESFLGCSSKRPAYPRDRIALC
jgi:hypothetical protein